MSAISTAWLAMRSQMRDNGLQADWALFPGAFPLVASARRNQDEGPPTCPPSSLSSLIQRSKSGDSAAMEEIYEHYKGPLFNLAYRYTYDRVAAEDLLQDIFIKIFTHLRDVQQEETFVAWIYRIAINTCFSYLRSKKSRNGRSVPLSQVAGKKEEAAYDVHEQSLQGPLEEAVQQLPEKLKTVFLLHDVQGYKHEEIAQMLGVKVGTSKSQLFKARLKIREILKNKHVL